MNYHCAKYYNNLATNMDTTHNFETFLCNFHGLVCNEVQNLLCSALMYIYVGGSKSSETTRISL